MIFKIALNKELKKIHLLSYVEPGDSVTGKGRSDEAGDRFRLSSGCSTDRSTGGHDRRGIGSQDGADERHDGSAQGADGCLQQTLFHKIQFKS